ncbi:MAG: DUF1330 domain-containing protein [Chloroflexota bacterium]|nr:DUF1330 domain-containing protein [Chloroflexota bacterium]
MAAYILADVTVHDPEAYREYTSQVPATLAPFQGRFVVRAGAYETLEGEWSPDRVVLIEFPTVEQARGWYASPAYQAILTIRHRNSDATFLALIEGVANS